ncbi:hypothetical protein DNTS_004208 [Danionella cerebrum]|uniref:Uncharacterized protein n=1 Tax=Danionella cerebrum TaxID=2873325 RepID=A0A553Q924_9TELE|nr:hypothetical protein DNTS_004208 [Danionella translucida]
MHTAEPHRRQANKSKAAKQAAKQAVEASRAYKYLKWWNKQCRLQDVWNINADTQTPDAIPNRYWWYKHGVLRRSNSLMPVNGETSDPEGTMESSLKDKRRSGRGLFRRVWKGLKSPFRRRKEDKVVDFVAESEVDESGIDIVQILRPTRTDCARPDPCLPGQLFADVEVAAAPGSQPGTPLPPPELSPDAPEENPRRTSQSKTMCSFFRKWHKTLRNLFLRPPPTEDRAQGLPASEPESSLLPEEVPVTLPDPKPIPTNEDLPSSRHFHPSFLELEDLAFGE